MVIRKLSRVNDMKYEYIFLKFPDSNIAAISEIEVNTQQKQKISIIMQRYIKEKNV